MPAYAVNAQSGSPRAALAINSWEHPFEHETVSALERLLPAFVVRQRWYRAKARMLQRLYIEDILPVGETSFCIVIQIECTDGESDRYQVPVSLARQNDPPADGAEVVASLAGPDGESGFLHSAPSTPAFRLALLDGLACETRMAGLTGELICSQTKAFPLACNPRELTLESSVSRSEQSNTSIIYANRFILKLFRKLELGVNPDIEIGTFLTERNFTHTPAVLGHIEYRQAGKEGVYAAALLQEFVQNKGDAWKYTLESLGRFFERVLNRGRGGAPARTPQHPMELMGKRTADVDDVMGEYLPAAELLGRRTAEMHQALYDPQAAADFAPEPFTKDDAEKLYQEMLGRANANFELLRRKESTLTTSAAESARKLLRLEQEIKHRFRSVRERQIDAVRIRFHGDFHLGQLLYTGSDFLIIDFEGEPARPLAERRRKALAMRDIAGMIRSFDYAAHAALFGHVPGVPTQLEWRHAVESWAAFWNSWAGAAYLEGYFSAADGQPFVPAHSEDRRLVLDALLLEKALYEVAYELNNRPDWVHIPLSGILKLVG